MDNPAYAQVLGGENIITGPVDELPVQLNINSVCSRLFQGVFYE